MVISEKKNANMYFMTSETLLWRHTKLNICGFIEQLRFVSFEPLLNDFLFQVAKGKRQQHNHCLVFFFTDFFILFFNRK